MASPKPGYIYVIWLREFLQQNEPVYKVGRTINLHKRTRQYPKGSRQLFSVWTEDTCKAESNVCSELALYFIHRTDIGREYFEGSFERLVDIIWDTVKTLETDQNDALEPLAPCIEDPPQPQIVDPIESLSKFVLSRRDILSGTVQKSVELYSEYTNWPHSLDMSFKRFVSGLRELYGATTQPYRFEDGMHPGITFPDLVSGPRKPRPTCVSAMTALREFVDTHIVPDHNGITTRMELWKLWKELDPQKTVPKRSFIINMHDIMAEKGFYWYNDTNECGNRVKCCWRGCRINDDS